MTLSFIAFLYPKADRAARVEEIAHSIVDYVKENEPGVLQYQCFRVKDGEEPTVVMFETYVDQAAVDLHTSSPKMAWLMETEKAEENFAKPFKLLALDGFGGWATKV